MIRILHAYFPARTVFLGISEACLVTLAFITATIARLGNTDASLMLNYEQGFLKICVVSVTFIICMYYFDLYDSSILSNRREVFTRLFEAFGTVSVILACLYYVYPRLELGRGIFMIGLAIVAAFLFFWRQLFLDINNRPHLATRVLIIGNSPLAESLMAELGGRPELGIRLVGHLRIERNSENQSSSLEDESGSQFLGLINSYKAERIIVALAEQSGNLPLQALLHLKSRGLTIQDAAQVYEAVTGKVPLDALRPSLLLFSGGMGVSGFLTIYKRVASVVWSTVGLTLASPLMALIALAIRLDSDGPIIFRQRRVGMHGEIFTLLKFRTMTHGANQDDNCRPAERMDTRFTRFGKFLRRTRMDELPQLFNILRGDMHFVGPRPFVPNQEKQCSEAIPFYTQRWAVKPGATGWAQVNRGYNVTLEDNKEKLAYDLFYIKNISVGLDLLILFKTFKILLLGRGAQ